MQTGYRMPRVPAPPDAVLKPSDLVPVTALNVKSLITWPAEGARLAPGRIEVRGVAWTGDGHVTRVEVAVGPDGEPRWHPATSLGEAEAVELAALEVRLRGRQARADRPPRPGHRLERRDPARGDPLEPVRLPLERDRPRHL